MNIEEGQLFAVYCEESSTDPKIGKCITAHGVTVRLSWLQGSYSTAWKLWRKRSGRHMVDWEDDVSTSSIILFDFKLTKTHHCIKSTVAHLKETYAMLRM